MPVTVNVGGRIVGFLLFTIFVRDIIVCFEMIVPGVVAVWTGLLSVSGEDIRICSVVTVILIFKTIHVIVVVVCSSSRTFFLCRGSANILKILVIRCCVSSPVRGNVTVRDTSVVVVTRRLAVSHGGRV